MQRGVKPGLFVSMLLVLGICEIDELMKLVRVYSYRHSLYSSLLLIFQGRNCVHVDTYNAST